jgi:hypothetical protein
LDLFAYFTIRVRLVKRNGEAHMVSGVAEDLATGQKHSFESGEDLLRIVGITAAPMSPLPQQPELGA